MLQEAHALADGSGVVFPSARRRPLSEVAISKMVRDLGIGAVPHGFRSSFRDWAAECSDAPREVCELALAHVNTNSIKAAYRRTDLFERRRRLMDEWAAYLDGKRRLQHASAGHRPPPQHGRRAFPAQTSEPGATLGGAPGSKTGAALPVTAAMSRAAVQRR